MFIEVNVVYQVCDWKNKLLRLGIIQLIQIFVPTFLKLNSVPEVNVATPDKDAVVLTGEMKNNLLDGNVSCYDMDRGFTRHSLDNSPQHILVKLGRPCIINHFRLVLWDKDPRWGQTLWFFFFIIIIIIFIFFFLS